MALTRIERIFLIKSAITERGETFVHLKRYKRSALVRVQSHALPGIPIKSERKYSPVLTTHGTSLLAIGGGNFG